MTSSSSDDARARAEAKFGKPTQQSTEADKVRAEHLAAEKVSDANRARLKALRLSQEPKGDDAKAKLPAFRSRRARVAVAKAKPAKKKAAEPPSR